MATSPLNRVIQHVLADVGPDGAEMTDGELLTRFLRGRDHDALAALVRRHASMVWGVCCRLLQNRHDAEDAFQATFLVLVRKSAVVPRLAVANWLYGVARQTSVRLRATSAKRRRRESQVVNMPEPSVAEYPDADLQIVLDEELSRLPDHYRGVIVLCDLEDLTRKEAARQLGIAEGSVASRLARARAMLAKRLTRRGVALSAGSIAAAGSATSAPPALVASTIQAATLLAAGQAAGVVSASVASLTDGVVKAMFASKFKSVVTVILVVGLTLGGIGAGISLSTNSSAVAQQPGAKPDVGKKGSDKVDWKVQVLDQQIAKLQDVKNQTDEEAAKLNRRSNEIERTIGDLRAQRERFLKNSAPKKDQKKGEQKQPEEAKDRTLTLEEPVESMHWSRDGTTMASRSTREAEVGGKQVTLSTFRVWDAKTGKLKLNHGEVEYPGFATYDLSPDGKILAISSRISIAVGDKVELYDAEKGTLLTTIEMEYGRSRPWFAFSPDSRTLAVCGFEFKAGKAVGTVRLFDAKKRDLKQKLVSHGGQVISVVFSPDGKSLAAGCATGEITVWDATTGKIKTKLDAAGSIAALAWSNDGKLLVSGGIEGGRVWDLATGKSRELKAALGVPAGAAAAGIDGESRINDLAFSPDGRYLAGDGGLVKQDDKWLNRILVWDTATGELRHVWLGLRGFAFAPDSKRLAILQDPKTVKLMDILQEQPAKGGQDAVPVQPKQPVKTDQERILGGWVIVNEDSKRKGEPWLISEHTILIYPNHSGYQVPFYYRLDAGKIPKQIDFSAQQNGSPAVKGIYSLEGDELRLCLGEKGKDRPAAFPEKPAPGEVLILHRESAVKKVDQTKAKEKQPMTKEEKLRVLIDQVLKAHGGEDKLNKLQFTMTVKHSNGYINKYWVQQPKNFRWEEQHRDQTKLIVILFPEGRRFWTKAPNQEAKSLLLLGIELPLNFWHDYVKFFGPRQVLRLKDADHKVALLDEEAMIGGRAAVGVQVIGPLCTQKMYFDKETHLLLKGVGSDIVREVTFSDYKKFDGIPIAQKEHDGHFEPVVTDFHVVDKFDAKLFEQP